MQQNTVKINDINPEIEKDNVFSNLGRNIKREWRKFKRRTTYRRLYNPNPLWIIISTAKSAPKRKKKEAASALWKMRWPLAAYVIDMVKGNRPHRNFFLRAWDDLLPLRMALRALFNVDSRPHKKRTKSQTESVQESPCWQDEEFKELSQRNPELAQLVAEKQQKMDEIRAKRKWTAREIFKTFIGISDLDKLDKEYDKKFDELARKQEAEANAGHESWGQKLTNKAHQLQSKILSFTKTIFAKSAPKAKQEGKSAITASIVPVAENSVVKQPAERPTPQPVAQKPSVLNAERTHKIEAILENKAKVLSEDRTITYAPDLSKLGDPDRVIAVLDSLIDDLRVKTLLTDHDMGSITLMSHIINAYGSGNKNLSYLNNLHVCDRFQLEVAHLVAIKLRANGINVPCKAYRIKNSSDSRAQIKQWRIALE